MRNFAGFLVKVQNLEVRRDNSQIEKKRKHTTLPIFLQFTVVGTSSKRNAIEADLSSHLFTLVKKADSVSNCVLFVV